MKNPKSLILWRGKSSIDGAPIVVIATGLAGSTNGKTGDMIQTHILRDDTSPLDAVKKGLDSSICGSCVHRGDGTGKGRTCYVQIGKAQSGVYKAYKRGSYPDYDPAIHDQYLRGKAIRFGSYGDPAAAPIAIWENLKKLASITTGYTHQWRTAAPEWSGLLMASADTAQDAQDAQAAGYRTFRVADEKIKGEVLCPASEKAGKKLQCFECGSCNGNNGRKGSIYIPLHGPNGKTNGKAQLNDRIIVRDAA